MFDFVGKAKVNKNIIFYQLFYVNINEIKKILTYLIIINKIKVG